MGRRGDLRLRKELSVARNQHPIGGELASVFVREARDAHRLHSGRLRKQRDGWLQIDMLIRNVESQNAAGREIASVERERFSSEQVQRDGVAGECVDHQNVEILRGLVRQRSPRVAFDD